MSVNYVHLRIRQATPEDAHAVLETEKVITLEPGQLIARPHELRIDEIRDKIKNLADHPRGVFFVADLEGEIVGHGLLDPLVLEAIQHVCNLVVVVLPKHQGHGIGVKLVESMVDWARTRSLLEKIELQVCVTNTPAIALYQKSGFKEEGRWLRRIKLGDDIYVDSLMMGLWL